MIRVIICVEIGFCVSGEIRRKTLNFCVFVTILLLAHFIYAYNILIYNVVISHLLHSASANNYIVRNDYKIA